MTVNASAALAMPEKFAQNVGRLDLETIAVKAAIRGLHAVGKAAAQEKESVSAKRSFLPLTAPYAAILTMVRTAN